MSSIICSIIIPCFLSHIATELGAFLFFSDQLHTKNKLIFHFCSLIIEEKKLYILFPLLVILYKSINFFIWLLNEMIYVFIWGFLDFYWHNNRMPLIYESLSPFWLHVYDVVNKIQAYSFNFMCPVVDTFTISVLLIRHGLLAVSVRQEKIGLFSFRSFLQDFFFNPFFFTFFFGRA